MLVESTLTNGLLNEYVFFNGRRVGRRTAAGAVYYFFSDHLGSVRLVTNATGGVVEDSDYYPFGVERVVVDNLDNRYKFTGQERDPESGLDHFLYRKYASNLGRWTTPDPVMATRYQPQSLNRYGHVMNNPTNLTDCKGLTFLPGPKCFLLPLPMGDINVVVSGVWVGGHPISGYQLVCARDPFEGQRFADGIWEKIKGWFSRNFRLETYICDCTLGRAAPIPFPPDVECTYGCKCSGVPPNVVSIYTNSLSNLRRECPGMPPSYPWCPSTVQTETVALVVGGRPIIGPARVTACGQ